MAGDTPAPLRSNIEGTPFNDGDGLEFRMASDFTLPYDVVDELRRVNDSFEPAATSHEAINNILEFRYPPTTPQEITVLTAQVIAARIYRMEPSETPFLRDEAA